MSWTKLQFHSMYLAGQVVTIPIIIAAYIIHKMIPQHYVSGKYV